MNQGEHILIIDDEESVTASLKEILEQEGYVVRTVSSSQKALRSLTEEPFDLVLTDLVTEGINGLDLIDEIKQKSPQTIVIIITGYASLDSAIEALRRGAYDYLTKPCPSHQLKVAIQRGLEKRTLGMALTQRTEELETANRRLNEQIGQIAALHRFSDSMHTLSHLEDALYLIANTIRNSLGFGRVLVSLVDKNEGVMKRRAYAGLTLTEFQKLKTQKPPLNTIAQLFKDKNRISRSYYIRHDESEDSTDQSGHLDTQSSIDSDASHWYPGDLFFTPLMTDQEELLGIISVDDPADNSIPSATTIKTLEAFANTASMAIERVAVEEKLAAINELSRELALALNFDHICDIVLRVATRVLNFDNIALILIDEDQGETYIAAHIGYPKEIETRRLPLHGQKGIIIQAIRKGEPLYVPDVRDNEFYFEGRPGTLSELAVPMKVKDKVTGVLNVESSNLNAFDSRDIALLSALASQTATAIEITHLVREINQTKNSLMNLIDSCPDVIISMDKEARLTFFSQRAEHIFGFTADEVLGKSISNYLTGSEEESKQIMDMLQEKKQLRDHETVFHAKDGTNVPVSLSASLLSDEHENIIGSIGICKDITERKQFEEEQKNLREQLSQSEKLSALGEFISGIAHELNNPLTGVLGFSQLLMHSKGDRDIKHHIEKIYTEAVRCQQIVSNLLSFAREQKPEWVSVDINVIIENALSMKAYQLRTNSIDVIKELETDLPRTLADPNQLEQVFLNIIINAYEALLHSENKRRLTVRTEHQGEILRIKFIDTGPGIVSDNLKRIFDPFYTTKEVGQGTGLGLSLAYGYIQEHEGSIYATSKVGQGATFVIELPVKDVPEPEPADREPQAKKPAVQASILVVDDEPVVLDLLSEILHQLGHHIDTANNGQQALEILKEKTFDLILTDLKMPGMDGRQLFYHISESNPDLAKRIIFISGYALSADMQTFLKESGHRHIEKPFDFNILREMIEQYL